MFNSLRARLLLWYTAILALVIIVFGVSVSLLAWRTRIADMDATLGARAESLAQTLEPTGAGTFDVTLPPTPETVPDDDLAPYHALWNDAGAPDDRSDPDLEVPMPDAPGARTRDGRREVAIRAPGGATVLVGRSLADVRAELWALVATIAGVGGGALVLALAGGWWLVGRALSPVDRISQTARAMVEGDLAARIPIDRVENELGHLARALNAAFDQMHASLERQRRFTADASHELRTPLATVSTEAQWALARTRSVDEYRKSFEASGRAAERMKAVVERLLSLARTEAGAADDDRADDVQIDHVVQDAVRDVSSIARARDVTVTVDALPASIRGDRERLLEAVTNVVANAVQYNQDAGEVRVRLEETPDAVTLTVADTGIGIGADDLGRVFEPFFRADPARSRDIGGAGLGLAVAHATVRQHGGHIRCESTPGAGTTVTITWPRAPRS
jgi:signal transduction histidine kinase